MAPKSKKIRVNSSATIIKPEQRWLSSSAFGRLDLTSAQRKLLDGPSSKYDDPIINSYARMCVHNFRDSFTFQDTCLGNQQLLGSFGSVDGKFIQIIHLPDHWVCVSNALTYARDPYTVEIFDSSATVSSIRSVTVLDHYLSTFILQLRPLTSCVRYIETQYQGNKTDCGPLALSFMWALAKGHHPKQYEYHLNGPSIRRRVKQTLIENEFKPPTNTSSRNIVKNVLKSFNYDPNTKQFVSAS